MYPWICYTTGISSFCSIRQYNCYRSAITVAVVNGVDCQTDRGRTLCYSTFHSIWWSNYRGSPDIPSLALAQAPSTHVRHLHTEKTLPSTCSGERGHCLRQRHPGVQIRRFRELSLDMRYWYHILLSELQSVWRSGFFEVETLLWWWFVVSSCTVYSLSTRRPIGVRFRRSWVQFGLLSERQRNFKVCKEVEALKRKLYFGVEVVHTSYTNNYLRV